MTGAHIVVVGTLAFWAWIIIGMPSLPFLPEHLDSILGALFTVGFLAAAGKLAYDALVRFNHRHDTH